MRVSLEREIELHADEELLAPKVDEPQIYVEMPHVEDPGVETSTQAKSSREGRKHTREVDILLDDTRENVGAPTSQHRIDNYFTDLGFTKSEADANLHYMVVEGKLLIIVLYVDDHILTVNQFSQAMVKPTKIYCKEEKHVLRYLRGTSQYGLWYIKIEGLKLEGFTDAYWAWSPFDRKNTSGGIFSIGSATISWYNMKHRSIALSLVEAEYMVASQAACEAI
eukprot:PITA_03701